MPRVKRGVVAHRRHNKIIKKAKGYYGARSRTFRIAKQAVIKAGEYAYRDRKKRKIKLRAIWIIRLNAVARIYGLSYSLLIYGLKNSKIIINRKILAYLAFNKNTVFNALVEKAKANQ